MALVLVSGLLSLLLMLSISALSLCRTESSRAASIRRAAEASLAADGGMEYAFSRLEAPDAPLPFDAAGRIAWKGRIRPEGAGRASFRLDIRAPEGAIPVNAGYLGSRSADLSIPFHRGLAHALDNLGVALGIATRLDRVPSGDFAGGNPAPDVVLSWLGQDLLARRPARGFADAGSLRAALLAAGYAPAEADRVVPFLDPGPYAGAWESPRAPSAAPGGAPPYAPVHLVSASATVLASLLSHVGCVAQSEMMPGASAGWSEKATRTGRRETASTLSYAQLGPGTRTMWIPLWPGDAERIALRLVALRGTGPLSWRGAFEDLLRESPGLFPADAADLASFPDNRRAWTEAKAELAFRILELEPPPFSPVGVGFSPAWSGWGIDRVPEKPGTQPLSLAAAPFYALPKPAAPGAGWGADPFLPFRRPGSAIAPLGGTMDPPTRFSVECRAAAGEAAALRAGEVRTCEILALSSQEDFESLTGGQRLARRGIAVEDDPPASVRRDLGEAPPLPDGRVPRRSDGQPRIQPRVSTLPSWSLRSAMSDAAARLAGGFPADAGAVTLAPVEAGAWGARLYWAFGDDLDGRLNAPGTDFWHETDPAAPFAPEPASPVPCMPPEAPALLSPWWGRIPEEDPDGEDQPFELQCPGFAATGSDVKAFAIEAWMTPGAMLELRGLGAISIDARREAGARGGETRFGISVQWRNYYDTLEGSRETATAPDVEAVPRLGGARHVVLSAQQVEGRDFTCPQTEFRLYVDGGLRLTFRHGNVVPPEEGTSITADGRIVAGDREALFAERVDELRLYDRALSAAEAAERYAAGRYVRAGTYASPRYRLPAGARLAWARWLGHAPADLYLAADPANPSVSPPALDAAGNPIRLPWPLSVELCLKDAAGPELTVRLGPPERTERLDAARGETSFRFRARFDCSLAAGSLNDTPVFDSLAIGYRTRERAWDRWQSR